MKDLAAADGDEGVDGLKAGLHGLAHRLARDDARGLHLSCERGGERERSATKTKADQKEKKHIKKNMTQDKGEKTDRGSAWP